MRLLAAASLALACVAILADATTTLRGLRAGRAEGNPIRRAAIRVLGLGGGTYGVALAVCAAAVAVNVWSHQPVPSLVVGNLILATAFGWAAWHNAAGN